jgi:CHAD domain-containing protein
MQTKIKSQPQRITLSDFAYEAIRKHYRKSIKHEAEVLDDRDPESLHQMRVGLRRLRTALQVFDFAIALPKGSDVQRIRKFAQVLGAVRDLDILEAKLKADDTLSKPEQKTRDRILKVVHHDRLDKFETLEKTLDSGKYNKFKDAFEEWLDSPEYAAIAYLPIQHLLPDLLLPLISKVLLHPAWLFGARIQSGHVFFDSLNTDQIRGFLKQQGHSLHDLRKQMKQVRYQTELFSDLYDDSYRAQVEEFKLIQDALGEIQDSVILNHYLGSQLDGDDPQKACPVLWSQLDEEMAQAWEQWRSFQEKYLQPEFRTELRLLLCAVPSEQRFLEYGSSH